MDSRSEDPLLQTREYGTSGPGVVVLHGGPGAPGYMAPVARELARSFRVLEPWQRGSGKEPLTVARHVSDLHDLVTSWGGDEHPALVGHSWGAMLVLAYAAAHPGAAGPLVLIGCGTFDPISRARLQDTLEQRMDEGMRRRRDRLVLEYPDPNERLRAMGNLGLSLYSFDVDASDQKLEACDARAHEESWADMVRLQRDGVYPAAFSAIDSPVIMLHGNADPHPGQLIRAGLEPHLPQLEYREWDRCGHYPWLERAVRDEFFEVLREWLGRRLR